MDIAAKTQKENKERVAEEYYSSLSDLNCNSKPLINMLTMLAEENIEYAAVIVKVVADHITKVPPDIKLPVLYLIDSIVKNVKNTYVPLFSQCIVSIFCDVFEKVTEKVRERMYALRQTWNEVFSPHKLYTLDVKVKRLDNNWPITAKQPQPSIHVNPNFLKTVSNTQTMPTDMEEILHAKTRELLELKKRKLELELEATKKHLEEQEKQLTKATESVIPPMDTLAAPNTALTPAMRSQAPPPQPTRMLPAFVTNNMMAPQHGMLHPAAPPMAMRPGAYQHNFRNPRAPQMPHLRPPGIMNMPPQGYPAVTNMGKAKIHPVDPALLNTVRHRDPRLARQQQQQQNLQFVQPFRNNGDMSANRDATRAAESSKPDAKKPTYRSRINKFSGGAAGASESKSPARHASSRSTGHSSKTNSSRDKDRERKRSESKSSTTSSSSAGSNSSSSNRRKGSTTAAVATTTTTVKDKESANMCDKDAFEIVPLSDVKHKSSSDGSSPSKTTKDSSKKPKESATVRNSPRSRSNRRSYSPDVETPKDVDLRKGVAPAAALENACPEKRFKLNDTERLMEDMQTTTTNATSKDLDKISNSANANAATATANETELPDAVSVDMEDSAVRSAKHMSIDGDNDDGKKRSSTEKDIFEPLPKKSKSAKLDALFGTEDVDLRTEIPPQMIANQKAVTSDVLIPPPPPIISDEESPAGASRENTHSKKAYKSKFVNTSKGSQKKLSLLDDVRAKLAKTAKYNKSKKSEASSNESNSRSKPVDLNVQEDTQEANDEKIRTIVTQAQELLEANSISQEQYRSLVQTVMSINESTKLEEAKRRESLSAAKDKSKAHSSADAAEQEESNVEAERREAVLKKRIPKIQKGAKNSAGETKYNSEPLSEKFNAENSPRYEDKHETNDDSNPGKSNNNMDRRAKPSKWGSRIDAGGSGNSATAPGGAGMEMAAIGAGQRSWLIGQANKHNRIGGFRSSVPHPPLPPVANVNLHLQPLPWQQIAASGTPPVFMNPMPAAMLCGNTPAFSEVPQLVLPTAAPAPPKPCNSIDNPQADLVRTITIDGRAKEIRIYDQVAIVFMELDQPREIGFQAGQRSIIIDNQEPIALQFNDEYRSFAISGESHRLRFGFPSRELYIDDNWYEIYFGGPPVSIPVHNKIHILKAEGPPPQVNIGPLRRDLVLGKINMIVDAHTVIPLFLDARVQTFHLGKQEHTIQFADNLLTVLLDGDAAKVEYGGLPKSMTLGGIKYFIRFGALPQGVVAGKVRIANMIYVDTKPEPLEDVKTEPLTDTQTGSRSPAHVQTSGPHIPSVPAVAAALPLPMVSLNSINVDELLQKLMSRGILPQATKKEAIEEEEAPVVVIHPIDLAKSETIKARQAAIVTTLFSGMQCSSCGVRFPPEQTIKYSQHLDWHFRQNRRERDSSRKAHSRRWYYELNDWVQYEEIEDLEEREKNIFESQQNELDPNDDISNQRSTNSPAPSCAAGPNDVDRICDMCNERFEQFYNEELEEWHLRAAIRVEDKIYHPVCYEDYKASLNPPKPTKEEQEAHLGLLDSNDDNAVDVIIKAEDDLSSEDIIVRDDVDDDDVIVLPNEEPSVTEIVDDDEEYEPFTVTREEMGIELTDDAKDEESSVNDAIESDVEIQEPHIPFTDLDTYVEKELPEGDESSQLSFANVKIKEEPKDDDDDDDDDFEDVGTVVITPDQEISVQSSSEEMRVDSSASPVLSVPLEADGATVNASPTQVETTESADLLNTTDNNVASMDGDLETEEVHNLSTVGPAPAISLASLVNKIKINITKNVASTTSAAANTSNDSSTSVTKPASPTVSTIPVLCGGTASTVAANSADTSAGAADMMGSNVSSISVIGASYGSRSSPARYQPQPMQLPQNKPVRQPTPPPPPKPVEETITFEQKATLEKAALKKVKKVECGVETSGLCSIM